MGRGKMKTGLKIVMSVVAVLFLGIVGYCQLIYPTEYPRGAWRYKMTVRVETPEGIKSGAAVREVRVRTGIDFPDRGSGTAIGARGEAVVVDMGKRGVMFGLMRSSRSVDYAYSIFFKKFSLPGKRNGAESATPEGVRYYNGLKSGKAGLSSEEYPEFVRFRDMKDPKSVELVDPNDLESSFGEGVKLLDVEIAITDEPVTRGIEAWLGWLPSHRKGYLDGQFAGGGPELSNILHSGDFQRGTNQ